VRRIPRKTLAMSLTAAIAFGASATALADGAADNTSQITSSLNSSLQSDTEPGKASLFNQVTTYDSDASPVITAEPAEVVTIDFPAELTYKTNNKLDQCDPDSGTFASDGTDAAVSACAGALVGSGIAYARIPSFPTTNNEAELTVSAFNGPPSVAGDNESDQVPANGGFIGGFPTIVLHADNAALPTTVVVGEVGNSTQGPNFGRRLWVPDAPDVARVGPDDFGALVLFNAQVSKSWTNGKSGAKKKKYNLVSATCDDSADGDWDFKGTWMYDDDSTDTDTVAQDCTTK
jgi:hypothetical protein